MSNTRAPALKWSCAPLPSSVPTARRIIRAAIEATDVIDPSSECAYDIAVCATEIITNAITHSRTAHVQVTLEWGIHAARLVVSDDSPVLPSPRRTTTTDTTGRGLELLGRLGRWGAENLGASKVVWCEVPYTRDGVLDDHA